MLLHGSDSTVAGTLTDDLGVFVLQAPTVGRFLFCGIPAGLRLYAGAIDPSGERGRGKIAYFTTPGGIHTEKLEIPPLPAASEGS